MAKKMKKRIIYLLLLIFCCFNLIGGGIYFLIKAPFQNMMHRLQKNRIHKMIEILYGYPQAIRTGPEKWEAVMELSNSNGAEPWINIILLDQEFFRTSADPFEPNPEMEERLNVFARGNIGPLLENISENTYRSVLWSVTAQLRVEGGGRYSKNEGIIFVKHSECGTRPIRDIAQGVLKKHLGVDHEYDVYKWREAIREYNAHSDKLYENTNMYQLVWDIQKEGDLQERIEAASKLAAMIEAAPWITVILLDKVFFRSADLSSEVPTDEYRLEDRSVIAALIANIPAPTDKAILWAITSHLSDEGRGVWPGEVGVLSLVAPSDGYTRPIREIARDVLKQHLGVDHEYDMYKWREAILDYKY